MKSYMIPIESASYYVLYTLFNVSTSTYNTSIYQHVICLVFIFLVVLIIIILYYDTVYREADNTKRCRDIDLTTKINKDLEYPYKYNIYVVHVDDVKNLLKNYIFYIQYDFEKVKSDVIFGNNTNALNQITFVESSGNIDSDYITNNAFNYYSLEMDRPARIEYMPEDNKRYYINKNIISGEDYKFIIARYDNKLISDDPSAFELLKFVKNFGYESEGEYTNTVPIFNIKYAIENNKNKISM